MSYSVKHKVGTVISAAIGRTSHEVGSIDGQYRDMTAFLADNRGHDGLGFDSMAGSPDDNWYVGNVFDDKDRYIDTIAIGGALDADHAQHVAKKQMGMVNGSYCTLLKKYEPNVTSQEPSLWSITAIKRLLSNPSQDKHYLPVITAAELEVESARLTFDSVQWSNDDKLLSHDGRDAKLYFELARLDDKEELTTQFDAIDEIKKLAADGIETELSFDALIESKARLPHLKNRLESALTNAATKELYVKSVVETEPFKRGGAVNIAFVFALSDGQDLSIWFHSPTDAKVQKLLPNDSMVSWKWMLNKKDVTAVLQPANGGDGENLGSLAKRMMRVANQNSNAFKRAKTREANQAREIAELESTVANYDAEITSLDDEILELNKKIAAAMSPKVAAEPEPPVIEPVVEPETPPATEPEPPVVEPVVEPEMPPAATTADNTAAKWWDKSADNVSVYLIGRSRKHSFVKITNTGAAFEAEVAHNKMMKYQTGTIEAVQTFIENTIKDDAGEVPKLTLVKGADVLNGSDMPAGEAATWDEEPDSQENEPLSGDALFEAESDFFDAFIKRSDDKSYFLDFGFDDVEPNNDGLYEIRAGYLAGKTVRYASTLFKIMDAVKSLNVSVEVADFNGTRNQLTMFDSLNKNTQPVYGITAQIANYDLTAIIRVSIDSAGDCEVLRDEVGDSVFAQIGFMMQNNVARYKATIREAVEEQKTINDDKRTNTDTTPEANMTTEPVVPPVVEPVVEPVPPAESNTLDLMNEIQVMNEIIDSKDFDPDVFDSSRVIAMLDETADVDVIDALSDLSVKLQSRMAEIALASMASMAGK